MQWMQLQSAQRSHAACPCPPHDLVPCLLTYPAPQGRNGPEDTAMALAALFDVLLTVCKVMAPFTPFFTGEPQAGL